MTDDAAPDDPWKAADESWRTWQAVTAPEDGAMHSPVAAGPRSVADGAIVELREVSKDDVRAICRLTVAPEQMSFVAPNAISFAEALFEPKAWYRGIYAPDTIPLRRNSGPTPNRRHLRSGLVLGAGFGLRYRC